MTYTIQMIVYRNPNLTPGQFKDHYENVHIPLMKSLLAGRFPLSHARRYIQRAGADQQYSAQVLGGQQSDFDFDCFSELKFESEAGFMEMSAVLASPEFSPKVNEDCMAFMDAAKTRIVVLGEVIVTEK